MRFKVLKENTTSAFSTYPIWFAVSPTPYLYKVLPSLTIFCNDNGLKLIIMMD
jgi:hypothetical protein